MWRPGARCPAPWRSAPSPAGLTGSADAMVDVSAADRLTGGSRLLGTKIQTSHHLDQEAGSLVVNLNVRGDDVSIRSLDHIGPIARLALKVSDPIFSLSLSL